ncbi:MAG: hypothetical protein EOO24_15505 [Comamonadaceae bacterium]|nr:MAG: hypothetical protein EOO24_15505 [Comamonadaceae bacterium]
MNDSRIRMLRSVAAGTVAALLVACGGGGGDGGSAAGWAPVALARPAAMEGTKGTEDAEDMKATQAFTEASAVEIATVPPVAILAYGAAAAVRPSSRGSNHLAVAGPPAWLSQ